MDFVKQYDQDDYCHINIEKIERIMLHHRNTEEWCIKIEINDEFYQISPFFKTKEQAIKVMDDFFCACNRSKVETTEEEKVPLNGRAEQELSLMLELLNKLKAVNESLKK